MMEEMEEEQKKERREEGKRGRREAEKKRGGLYVFSPGETDKPCDYLLSYLLML